MSYGRQPTQVHLYKGDLDQTLIRDLHCRAKPAPHGRRTPFRATRSPHVREWGNIRSNIRNRFRQELSLSREVRAARLPQSVPGLAKPERPVCRYARPIRGLLHACCVRAALERRTQGTEEKVRGGEAGQTREQACEGKAGQRREQVCEGRGGQRQKGGGEGGRKLTLMKARTLVVRMQGSTRQKQLLIALGQRPRRCYFPPAVRGNSARPCARSRFDACGLLGKVMPLCQVPDSQQHRGETKTMESQDVRALALHCPLGCSHPCMPLCRIPDSQRREN